jgi:exopolysaccharide production protein ExoZ
MAHETPPQAGRQALGSLEIGRFVAASLVMLAHYLADLPRYARHPGELFYTGVHTFSAAAVQFFFVLSGFVMMTAHRRDFGRLASIQKFWFRRAGRIYPVYWLSLAIMVGYLHGFLTQGCCFS